MNWCMLLGHSAKGRQQIDRTWKDGRKEGRQEGILLEKSFLIQNR